MNHASEIGEGEAMSLSPLQKQVVQVQMIHAIESLLITEPHGAKCKSLFLGGHECDCWKAKLEKIIHPKEGSEK